MRVGGARQRLLHHQEGSLGRSTLRVTASSEAIVLSLENQRRFPALSSAGASGAKDGFSAAPQPPLARIEDEVIKGAARRLLRTKMTGPFLIHWDVGGVEFPGERSGVDRCVQTKWTCYPCPTRRSPCRLARWSKMHAGRRLKLAIWE
jgi:hypothetical protein